MNYRVKNWKDFQHYKDRDPPWIKLHFSLLSSSDWVMLDDSSRVLAIACMLIASRNHGDIPDDPAYLKRVAYLRKTPNFKPLIDCGFLVPASDCKQEQAKDTPEAEESRDRAEREPLSLFLISECPKDMDVEKERAAFQTYYTDLKKEPTSARWRSWVVGANTSGKYAKQAKRLPTEAECAAERARLIAKMEAG